ncbi:HAMP domain-containing sensor histidine kinase [Gangjinia marincola]|uniref:histidine kinase n=1 Tax=Gangjinia marincola TaxID=578463 RepID=A0ABP3XUC7_9FLAO
MGISNLSLRNRIFFTMILLVLGASILIAGVTIYQYNEEASDYHTDRLERKEEAVKEEIAYVLRNTTFEVVARKLPIIFKEKGDIFRIAEVHNLPINLYDLEGSFLVKSKQSFFIDTTNKQLDRKVLDDLKSSSDKRVLYRTEKAGETFVTSYSYVTDNKFKPLAILNIPYAEDDDFITRELTEFLQRLGEVYLFMLLVAILLAYFLSNYITKSIKTISDKITKTRLDQRNEKIEIANAGQEMSALITAYNGMIDELEESAVKLASSEREQAWREMAKQVAHEIKNPLTPMRLSVQNFQRRFDPKDPQIDEKVDDFSKTLIQQIDTMSNIASAFSNFAKMPAQQKEELNVTEITRLALDIFDEDYIHFSAEKEEIKAVFDRTQLIRVVTNLVKNAKQAITQTDYPSIYVSVTTKGDKVHIDVADNGAGITEENKPKIFEPKFTTKSSGMGLGLAMVKNIVETYNGTITFTSQEGKGTTFTVCFPIISDE